MPRTMPVTSEWLRADAGGRPIGVDRENNRLLGYVVAQLGPFKSEGRGEFDEQSLQAIVQLMSANRTGTKSRFKHPTLSNDGLGSFLGRSHNPRLDSVTLADGRIVAAARADLHFDATSFDTPSGNLGDYVMRLAESDPDALSSSLVLRTGREWRTHEDGSRKTDAKGEPLPPIWRPEKIHASDIVDIGDAVDGLLSASVLTGELPDAAVRAASQMLDQLFAGQPRDVVEARCSAWLDRYLSNRYGDAPAPTKSIDLLRRRLALLEKSF